MYDKIVYSMDAFICIQLGCRQTEYNREVKREYYITVGYSKIVVYSAQVHSN